MIDVYISRMAQRQRRGISVYLWSKLPCGNDEEFWAAVRMIDAEQAKVDRTIEQLRRLPESGPVKAGVIRTIVVPDSRYTVVYRISKNFKRVTILRVRGAQKPSAW